MIIHPFIRWLQNRLPGAFTDKLAPSDGQGLVEYALILVLVAVIVIIILAVFGTTVGNLYSNVIGSI